MSDTSPLIARYFKVYCDFFNADLESAVLESRNFTIVDMFRTTLILMMSNNVPSLQVNKLLSVLEKAVNEEREIYSQIDVIQCKLYFFENFDEIFKISSAYFLVFFHAYDFLYSVFVGDDYDSNHDRKFQDILVEFNNALSHLLVSLSNYENEEVRISNIQRANTHLYRGALDSYKEVINKNRPVVENSSSLHTKLDNKTFKDFYITLRTLEASKIGKSEEDKMFIIEKYKLLSWELVN